MILGLSACVPAAVNGGPSIGRKRPIPHESWFAVAGYFFYYGHYYAALCLEDLKDSKNDAHHGGQLAAIILLLRLSYNTFANLCFV